MCNMKSTVKPSLGFKSLVAQQWVMIKEDNSVGKPCCDLQSDIPGESNIITRVSISMATRLNLCVKTCPEKLTSTD